MTQTAIEAYISEAREQGLTEDAIREVLVKNGWSSTVIDAGLQSAQPQSNKEYLAAVLLSIFLGMFGVDRFYLGRYLTGVLKLVTIGGFGIWYLIDMFLILFGKLTDSKGRTLCHYHRDERMVKIVFFIALIANLIWSIPYLALSNWDDSYDTQQPHHNHDRYDREHDDLETI